MFCEIIRIVHGWTARTICQVALRDFAQRVAVSQDIRVRPLHWKVWNCLKVCISEVWNFSVFLADSSARLANPAWAYCKLPIFHPLIHFPLYCKDIFHAEVHIVSSFSYWQFCYATIELALRELFSHRFFFLKWILKKLWKWCGHGCL